MDDCWELHPEKMPKEFKPNAKVPYNKRVKSKVKEKSKAPTKNQEALMVKHK